MGPVDEDPRDFEDRAMRDALTSYGQLFTGRDRTVEELVGPRDSVKIVGTDKPLPEDFLDKFLEDLAK